MLGSMITKIRKDKHITKMELARRTGINIGHITHIEKGERTPSHKTLKLIASALDVPYQILSYLYDEENKEEYKRCNMINHLIIRRFIIRKDKLVLRAENKSYDDIDLNEDDDFKIIGKIIKNQI